MKFGIDWPSGQAVLEKKMFGNNGHIHAFSPWVGTDKPLGTIFFSNYII